jgi:hypothetical protein
MLLAQHRGKKKSPGSTGAWQGDHVGEVFRRQWRGLWSTAEMGFTVHGFRSSFEDWGAEAASFPRDIGGGT